METMRVLLADDHALFRDGLAGLLRAWDMDVVAQAGDGVEAVAVAEVDPRAGVGLSVGEHHLTGQQDDLTALLPLFQGIMPELDAGLEGCCIRHTGTASFIRRTLSQRYRHPG